MSYQLWHQDLKLCKTMVKLSTNFQLHTEIQSDSLSFFVFGFNTVFWCNWYPALIQHQLFRLPGTGALSEVGMARHTSSGLNILLLFTSHSPICAPHMSSQHSNPSKFILTVFAPITSFSTAREDMYLLCYRPAGCVWYRGGWRTWHGAMVGSRKLLLKVVESGENHAWWSFAVDATQLPLCFLGIWC